MNNNIRGLASWMLWGAAAAGSLWISLYLFAFLLPVILILFLAGYGARAWRLWQLNKILSQNAGDLFKRRTASSASKKSGSAHHQGPEIIDVEYEILDDGYKSNKSE